MIEIDYSLGAAARDYRYDVPTMQLAADKLNLLLDYIYNGNYDEGCRNNIAVNLCCLCWVLALSPTDLAKQYIVSANGYSSSDFNDIANRIQTIKYYLPDWDKYGSATQGVLDYMLTDGSENTECKDQHVMLLV